MTNPNHRHVLLIVDRSGSMASIRKDTEGGIQSFLEDQRQLPQRTTVGLVEFDHEARPVHWFTNLEDVLAYSLKPRGTTSLLDALGTYISKLGEELAALHEDDRPGEVVVVIVTDGQENSSQEYRADAVKRMITEQQEKYGWTFLYLGANQDAITEAAKFGVPSANSVTYSANTVGTQAAWASVSGSVLRGASGLGYAFTDEDRKNASGV